MAKKRKTKQKGSKRPLLGAKGTVLASNILSTNNIELLNRHYVSNNRLLKKRIMLLSHSVKNRQLSIHDEMKKSLFKTLDGDSLTENLVNSGYISLGGIVKDDAKNGTRTYIIPGAHDKPEVKLIRNFNSGNDLTGFIVVGNSMTPFSLSKEQIQTLEITLNSEMASK